MFSGPFCNDGPRVTIFILTNIIGRVITLNIRFIMQRVRTNVTSQVVVRATIRRTNPSSSWTVFMGTICYREEGLQNVRRAIIRRIVFVSAIVNPSVSLSLLRCFSTTSNTILCHRQIFRRIMVLSSLSHLSVRRISTISGISSPRPIT